MLNGISLPGRSLVKFDQVSKDMGEKIPLLHFSGALVFRGLHFDVTCTPHPLNLPFSFLLRVFCVRCWLN